MKLFRLLILLFFLSVAGTGYAQNIDSLKRELRKASSDHHKIHLFYSVGHSYHSAENFDSSFAYFRKAAVAARNSGDDSMVMEAQISIYYSLLHSHKFKESIPYTDTAIQYARRLDLPGRLSLFLVERAVASDQITPDGTLPEICRIALDLAQKAQAKDIEARIYFELGSYYRSKGNFSPALDYYNKSHNLYDSLHYINDAADCYYEISIIYSQQKKYNDALRYAKIVDSMYSRPQPSVFLTPVRNHIAILYKNLGNYDHAIRIYNELIVVNSTDSFILTILYSNLAIAQSLKGSFEEARRNFMTSIAFNSVFHVPALEIDNYLEMSKAYTRVRKYDSALYYGQLSERLCTESKAGFSVYKDVVAALIAAAEGKGNITLANAYHKKYEALQDSIYNELRTSGLADAETRFNVAEKNKELFVLAAENDLNKALSRKQTLLNITLAIGLLLGILIVIVVVVAYRRTLQKNAQLHAQKIELEQQKITLQEQKGVIDEQVVQLSTAATMKSKFLANISHELRTPVTLLNGMLEIMSSKKQAITSKEKERLDIAYNNSRKLQQMVEEILDLTRLENNRSQPVYETIEVAPFLRRMVYAFETLVEKEQLVLSYNDEQAGGTYISIDPGKFEKIINNLVYNAIKFNRKGGFIKVTVHSSSNNKSIQVEVSDSGIGIADEDMPHIFEHFYQGNSSGLKADGAGIGLSLVKEFTILMGGTIAVKSTYGTGTTFSLQFPQAEMPAIDERSTDQLEYTGEAWDSFTRRQRILIVEDNAEMRYYLKDVLGDKVDIATAENGTEALEWLQNNLPDLVISDVMMPGMDGRELVTRIKADAAYNKIPVITLTALADMENHLSMLRLGVDDYIVKPFNADELRVRVYNLLHNSAARRQFNQEPKDADDVVVNDDSEAAGFRDKIKDYVLKNLKNENISVSDMAMEFLLSERQLFRLAKSLTGCTPGNLIKEVRLQKAYELLLSGKVHKIDDVSRRVGFETTSYFVRQFVERFGKRPTDML